MLASGGPERPDDTGEVEAALEILVGDHQRTGRLTSEDIARVCSKRQLTGQQINELAGQLKDRGITLVEEDIPDGFDDAGIAQSGLIIPRLPLLKAEEEKLLGHVYRTGERLRSTLVKGREKATPEIARLIKRSENARDELILRNLRLVAWVANRYRWTKLEFSDLFEEGVFGLIRAVEYFDPTLGYRFSTYATWWILQTIRRGIDNTAETIRIPVHRLEAIRRYRRMVARLRAEYGVDPSITRLAAALEWSVEQTAYVADLALLRTVSIDTPISDDDDATLQDIIPDTESVSPEQAIILQEMRSISAAVLRTLTPREERVLRMRFGIGIDSDHTLEEVGRQFGVTRERIRQIEAKALRLLKHPSRSRTLRSFLD
jgi:RNA polymerase primary sigma factor